MGTSAPLPLPKKPKRRLIKNISRLDLDDLFDSIPNDQYLCQYCGQVPELVNIHVDNGTVEFKCRCNIDEEQILPIERFFQILKSNTYYNTNCCLCQKLQKEIKNETFKYCYKCKKDYCKECLENEEKHPRSHIDECIPINSKMTRCLEHFKEGPYNSFCLDCHLNVCKDYHKGHKIIDFDKILPDKDIILKKNKALYNIIKFNELILNTYESFPDNYFHAKNVANLAESIKAENDRNPKVLEKAFQNLESNIKEFNEKYKTSIKRDVKELSLQNIGLKDSGLKLLANIDLLKIIDLNLSGNQIKDIYPLKGIKTTFMKYLNLNDNNIEDIKVLESMNLKSLIELQLKNNNIKSVSPLLNTKMPSIKFLRFEGNNNLDRSLKDFKKVVNKFIKQFIYVVQTYEDFNKKYDLEPENQISEDSKKIDLTNSRRGNDILKDLYSISSNYDKLEIIYLYNCEIDDISYFERMSLKNLKILDLSNNKIKNIEVLPQINCKKLQQLYLDDNEISYITPLKYMKSSSLNAVSIKNNKIMPNDQEVKNLKEIFEKRDGAISF